MYKKTAAALLMIGGLAGSMYAQTSANPTQQQSSAARQDQVPMFRITVVGRTTPAINYRPRKGATNIDFAGTALMPDARGKANVEGERGYIQVDARFDKLGAPSRFGPEYLTYVLWAVTPEGRAQNLGEVQVNGDDGQLKVTTELQAFGLIVTAEPYFSVTQPSDVVVLENVVREGWDRTVGRVEPIVAKYELLKRGSYLMNQDPASYRLKPLEPGAPLDLAEARNAVQLSRLAGADKYAEDTFAKAARLLTEAEMAREKRRASNAIMMPARQAAQTAEDARLISLRRQEEEYAAEQRAIVLRSEAQAKERAREEEARRRQADVDRLAEEARRRQAEIDKLASDAARTVAERERADADAARLAAERRKAEADAAFDAAQRAKADADAARTAAEAARAAAEAQTRQAREQADATAAQAEREKAELREKLRQQLNVILETRETARGLIVNVSDVLFDTGSANLKPGAREKLARVSGILLGHPDLKIAVEGHTDSVGSDSYNQGLSERRANSVRDYIVRQGIAQGGVATAGYGESQPVASNNTAAGRQQNRRVELVVTGESIGRR